MGVASPSEGGGGSSLCRVKRRLESPRCSIHTKCRRRCNEATCNKPNGVAKDEVGQNQTRLREPRLGHWRDDIVKTRRDETDEATHSCYGKRHQEAVSITVRPVIGEGSRLLGQPTAGWWRRSAPEVSDDSQLFWESRDDAGLRSGNNHWKAGNGNPRCQLDTLSQWYFLLGSQACSSQL